MHLPAVLIKLLANGEADVCFFDPPSGGSVVVLIAADQPLDTPTT